MATNGTEPFEIIEKEAKAIFDALGIFRERVLKVQGDAEKVNLDKASAAASISAKELEELRTQFLFSKPIDE